MEKPEYKIHHSIMRKKDIYKIIRPDGSIVNETEFKELKHAEGFLSRLKAMNYCK